MSRYDEAIEIVLDAEGGYSDDAHDPGGKTRYGITEAVARANGYQGPMREFPLEHAKTIYREDYWDACRCDDLPWPLAMYVFDAAVNQGRATAITMLQHALDTTQDGLIGANTMRLARASTHWHAARFLALRAQRYTQTRNYERFGQGWFTRLFTIAMEA